MKQATSVKTLFVNAVGKGMLPEMLRKAWLRIKEPIDQQELASLETALAARAVDADAWAKRIDADLWQEACTFADEQQVYSDGVMATLPVVMGGGGFYALLYFMTRLLKPKQVVETGVAAGFSSRAFLKAMQANGAGHLSSSDFPYFRLENPEKYSGVLVEADLRSNWTLMIGSDRDNLPKVAATGQHIDLLHYDSDKSVAGRSFALKTLAPVMSKNTLIMFDDIQDNAHFLEWEKSGAYTTIVFAFGGKYIGMAFDPASETLKSLAA